MFKNLWGEKRSPKSSSYWELKNLSVVSKLVPTNSGRNLNLISAKCLYNRHPGTLRIECGGPRKNGLGFAWVSLLFYWLVVSHLQSDSIGVASRLDTFFFRILINGSGLLMVSDKCTSVICLFLRLYLNWGGAKDFYKIFSSHMFWIMALLL